MSIAKGDFLIDQVYKSGTGVNKIYKGTDLVYDRSLKNKFEYFYVYAAEPLRDDEATIAGTVTLENNGGNAPNIEYSRDGVNWTTWDYSSLNLYGPVSSDESSPIYNFIFFRGNNPNGFSSSSSVYSRFIIIDNLYGQAYITIGGNIMSLLYKDSFWKEDIYPNNTIPNNLCFALLFSGSDIYSCLGGPGRYNNSNIGVFRLPATVLSEFCYMSMFSNCRKLNFGPTILPATTLTRYCYGSMFSSCYYLKNTPNLPATTLAIQCYNSMFSDCRAITTPPNLPATTLADYCYQSMFYRSIITESPVLPALTLTTGCYREMFKSCTAIQRITMLATDISATSCLQNWVDGISSATGTFVKNKNASWSVTGRDGIPNGWTVEEV